MWDRRINAVPVIDAHTNVLVDDAAVDVRGHVDSPEPRRAILLAAEDKAAGCKVVDRLVGWRVPGYV